jgi:hypothetical protein
MLSETWRYPLGGGSGTKVLELNPEGTGDEIANYSPDGTKIVFDRLPSYQIMTADPDGSNVALLGSAGSGIAGSFAHWSSNIDDCTDPGDPGAATMKINEVGLGGAQFIELLDPADETFPSAQQPYRVVVYDGAGTRQGAHTISSALLQGRDNTIPLLLSTAAADIAYGVIGDEVLSRALPSPGQACFTKGFDETKVDCVSWGCVTVAVSGSSTRIPAPGAGSSAQRQGVGSTIFHLAPPTPKATNVAGAAVLACGPGALPTVTGIVPASGTILGGTAVTITGTNFTGATSVTIGGTAATIGTVNATSITATTPAHAAGPASVLVTTPGGTNAPNTLYTYATTPGAPITVTKSGSGSGTVTSSVGAINCGPTCSDTYASGTAITLTATPTGGNQFTGWLGPCTGIGTCTFTINAATTATATFALTPVGTHVLGIDGNTSYDALTDGLLAIRYLFGLSGAPLIGGAVGPGATRITATDVGNYLTDIRPLLDIDGNGQADASTDGLLIIRYMFGLRGASLIAGAVGPNAIRTTAAAIETQLQSLMP